MNREDIIRMTRESGVRAAKLLDVLGTEGALCDSEIQELRAAERLAKVAYDAGAAAEREACKALHQHEDVLAPVGNSAWGEAYQEGWAAGTAAYRDAILARSNT